MKVDAELTLAQVEIMNDVCGNMPVFVLGMYRQDDDGYVRERLRVANEEVDQLVALGFIEDLTSKNLESMDKLEHTTGHKHRVFSVSKLGKQLFKASASAKVN